MQDLNNGESTSPPLPRESNLPLLAPRLSQSSTAEKSSASTETTTPSGRPPRPSNRSRAGCWTCRGRKVLQHICRQEHHSPYNELISQCRSNVTRRDLGAVYALNHTEVCLASADLMFSRAQDSTVSATGNNAGTYVYKPAQPLILVAHAYGTCQFSNATATTQSKYVNVSTAGNAVWDRTFSPLDSYA